MYVCAECGRSYDAPGFCTEDGGSLAEARDPLIGSVVGNYRITSVVGFGAMGTVYKAAHPTIGSRVAVKVLATDPGRSSSLIERFFSEARAVNLIRHEHIVNVLDLSALPDGRPYIVMEYLDGMPLSSLFESTRPFPLGTLARLMGEVLDALSAAHAKGIVHRDLKPDNLFVTPAGHIKVLDFGIAKLKGEAETPGSGTRTGALLGTPHYMSPEQARGQPVDARADLYAVGVILYEGATGQKPFDANALFELLRQHLEAAPRPPGSLRPDLPPAYEQVILRALEKDPARRFGSASELAHALVAATGTLAPDAWTSVTPGSLASASLDAARRSSSRGTANTAPMETPATMPAALAGSAPPPGFYGGTYGGASISPRSAEANKSRMVWILAALGGALALGIVALVAVGALASGVFLSRAEPPETKPTPMPVEPEPDEPPGFGTPSNVPKAPSTNLTHFDPWAFFPEAERLAKNEISDARFVRFDSSGMRRDGIVDLTSDDSYNVLYRFRSPSRSQRPPSIPENAEYKAKCMVYVNVDHDGVRPYALEWTCEAPFVNKPRCSPAQVWRAGEAKGAPSGNLIGSLGYWPDDGGRGRWLFDVRGRFNAWIPDSC
jgi:serine/threonine protein kinase